MLTLKYYEINRVDNKGLEDGFCEEDEMMIFHIYISTLIYYKKLM